jgi:hypothetical protein
MSRVFFGVAVLSVLVFGGLYANQIGLAAHPPALAAPSFSNPINTALLATCVMITAQTYEVPPGVLLGISQVQNGKAGEEKQQMDGSYNLGVMQINTKILPIIAHLWAITEEDARKSLKDDTCLNFAVAGWILRQKINQTGNLWNGIALFPQNESEQGEIYSKKVESVMRQYNLTDRWIAAHPQATQ